MRHGEPIKSLTESLEGLGLNERFGHGTATEFVMSKKVDNTFEIVNDAIDKVWDVIKKELKSEDLELKSVQEKGVRLAIAKTIVDSLKGK